LEDLYDDEFLPVEKKKKKKKDYKINWGGQKSPLFYVKKLNEGGRI